MFSKNVKNVIVSHLELIRAKQLNIFGIKNGGHLVFSQAVDFTHRTLMSYLAL